MEEAPRYKLLVNTVDTVDRVDTVDMIYTINTVHTIQTASQLHCLDISMYAYIHC